MTQANSYAEVSTTKEYAISEINLVLNLWHLKFTSRLNNVSEKDVAIQWGGACLTIGDIRCW